MMSALIEFNVLNRKCGWSRDSSERRRASATSCSARTAASACSWSLSSLRRRRSRIEAYEHAPSPNTTESRNAPRIVCRYCRQKSSGTATPVHISRDWAARQPIATKRVVAASTAAGNGQRRSISRSTIAGPASTAGMAVTFV